MILCSCNIISDRDIRACVKPCGASADKARDVFRCLGRTPKCGRCVRKIQSLFEQENAIESTDTTESLDFRLAAAAE
jgi:bacterioferritin-associated ferredoxin